MPPKMTTKQIIEQNRRTINDAFDHARSVRRIHTMNSLRHGIGVETINLIQFPPDMKEEERKIHIDYTSIANLELAWDYIVENINTKIDMMQIRKVHAILSQNTDIMGGVYRQSDAFIERLQTHAPTFHQMLYKLENVEYSLNNKQFPIMTRAFNAHFDIIAAQPFDDFNKRTARLIMNWFLLQNKYTPILFTGKTDRADYMSALLARQQGRCKTYSHYLYQCMVRTQSEIIKNITRTLSF